MPIKQIPQHKLHCFGSERSRAFGSSPHRAEVCASQRGGGKHCPVGRCGEDDQLEDGGSPGMHSAGVWDWGKGMALEAPLLRAESSKVPLSTRHLGNQLPHPQIRAILAKNPNCVCLVSPAACALLEGVMSCSTPDLSTRGNPASP